MCLQGFFAFLLRGCFKRQLDDNAYHSQCIPTICVNKKKYFSEIKKNRKKPFSLFHRWA